MNFKEIILLSILLFIFVYGILNRICDCIEYCRDSKSMESTFKNLKIDQKKMRKIWIKTYCPQASPMKKIKN